MSSVFEFLAESRSESGKSGAKAIRRGGKVPAVIYGRNSDPVMLTLDHNDVIKRLQHEAVYSHILGVTVDGKAEKAILKDVQRHPSKVQIMHMDFLRVSETEKIRVHVPVHCVGEDVSVGVKKGGVVTHNLVDIEVSCLPSDLPEYLEADITNVDVGESVHLSDIVIPSGVEVISLMHGEGHDLPIASIAAAKGPAEDEVASEESGELGESEETAEEK